MIDSDLYGKLENLIEEYISRDIKDHIGSELPEVVANRTENGDESQRILDAIYDFNFIGKYAGKQKILEIAQEVAEGVSEKIHNDVIGEIEKAMEDMLDQVESEIKADE